jgi:periplasmic protein TonB
VNALDRRHPSQRRYYRNVRIAMTLAVLTHAAVFAWVPVPHGVPRPFRAQVLTVVEASGLLLARIGEGAAAVAPPSDVPGPSAPVESFRAVDPAVRTVAAAEEEAIAPGGGAVPTGTSGGEGSGGAAGYGSATADVETEVFYAYDTPPRTKRRVTPAYPAEARAAGLEGSVVVNVNIDDHGRILRAWVAQSNAADVLVSAALDAVYQFEFEPGKWRDTPVRCTVAIPFQFHLKQTIEMEGR